MTAIHTLMLSLPCNYYFIYGYRGMNLRSLSDYLNIEDTVQLVREVTKVPFFNEGNLFDLVVKKEIQPIIYFDGCGSIFTSKERSLYPEDFESDTDGDDFDFGKINDNEQLNYVKKYFHLMFGELLLKAAEPEQHFQFKIQNLVDYKAIPNKTLPNSGMNSKYDVHKKTPLHSGDFIMLSTYSDEVPVFAKNDIKFYVLDIINMMKRNGCYSTDNKEGSKLASDKEANPKDSAYHLIAILKDLLLNPDTNPYHFKTDNSKSTNQPTQAGLAEYIDAMDIRGLKARNINGIFSQANKLLNDAQKS